MKMQINAAVKLALTAQALLLLAYAMNTPKLVKMAQLISAHQCLPTALRKIPISPIPDVLTVALAASRDLCDTFPPSC
jgi:hypothetical protein